MNLEGEFPPFASAQKIDKVEVIPARFCLSKEIVLDNLDELYARSMVKGTVYS